jgi:hypothetical protein
VFFVGFVLPLCPATVYQGHGRRTIFRSWLCSSVYCSSVMEFSLVGVIMSMRVRLGVALPFSISATLQMQPCSATCFVVELFRFLAEECPDLQWHFSHPLRWHSFLGSFVQDSSSGPCLPCMGHHLCAGIHAGRFGGVGDEGCRARFHALCCRVGHPGRFARVLHRPLHVPGVQQP